jgi:hypothetical protein
LGVLDTGIYELGIEGCGSLEALGRLLEAVLAEVAQSQVSVQLRACGLHLKGALTGYLGVVPTALLHQGFDS